MVGVAVLAVVGPPAVTPVESGQGTRKTFPRECCDVGVTCLVEELLDLLLTDGQPTQAGLDALHCQCEQCQQHWEEHHSESLHRGK